jgi:hypothetical protein
LALSGVPALYEHVQEILDSTRIEVIDALEINRPPKEEDIEQIIEVAKTLAERIKESEVI